MLTVAYLANRFPAAVEPYVDDEIRELRRRGVDVIPGSVRRLDAAANGLEAGCENEIVYLQPIRIWTLLRALALALRRWRRIACLARRIFLQGGEVPKQRVKALLHTLLGACYAVRLRKRGVNHIHVHHGYFGAWIAMTAARLLNVTYSLTLHGSDLLVDGVFLDTKLEHCQFCATVSEYNRRHILKHFPATRAEKISVSRLGVEVAEPPESLRRVNGRRGHTFTLVAVGRLHAVKDHAFLVRACARLRDRGLNFDCAIAGDGPDRKDLELLIQKSQLQGWVELLGHVDRSQRDALYSRADVVVLTSRSEGIPLVLMEAMARGRIVLAPSITGIPEIVLPGKTGFLYVPGILEDFVEKVLFLYRLTRAEDRAAVSALDWIRHAARIQILHNFNRTVNLSRLGDKFLQLIASPSFL